MKLLVKRVGVAVAGPVERAWALRWMRRLRRAGLRLRQRGRVRLPAAGGERAG